MAIEDLTTYTEEDTEDKITITSSRSTVADLRRNDESYLYKDHGENHFDGDFEHDFEVEETDRFDVSVHVIWELSNDIDDLYGSISTNEKMLFVWLLGGTAIRLYERYGVGQSQYDAGTISEDTPYYLTVERDEGVGDHGTIYCRIYDDSERTNLVDTLTLTLNEKGDFRYLYTTNAYNDGDERPCGGYTQNYDLNEAAVGIIMPVFSEEGIHSIIFGGLIAR